MAVEIVFETHSISVDNERGIATGWLDGCLSEKGRLLAKELGERRRRERIDAVFTSDLGRAVETATIAFGDSGIPMYLDKRLRECNYGFLNGMPTTLLELERAKHIDAPFPEGESYRDVVARIQEFLQDLSHAWDGKLVVIIGHSATRWALGHLLCGQVLPDLVNAPFAWREGWRYLLGEASSHDMD
ncbi:MAG: histidine phosphatase family protein [Chloroflexi bacterium]|nr:histidine phosphatase family protein [Chloroflexota bacterium]